jgi:hypothetical protein
VGTIFINATDSDDVITFSNNNVGELLALPGIQGNRMPDARMQPLDRRLIRSFTLYAIRSSQSASRESARNPRPFEQTSVCPWPI